MRYRIHRKKDGTFGVIIYEGSHRRRIALKAPNKWLAQTEASDLVADIERRRPKEVLNVSQIVALYLEQTEAISKQDMIYHFKPVLETLGPMSPDAITEEVCKRYAGDRKRSAGTIRVELGLMNTALKWAKKHKKIAEAPWVWMPPAPPPRDRTLSREEANRLIEACCQSHVKTFVILALNSAGRASALLGLTWQAVDLASRRIDLGGTGRQKKRAKWLPINETLHAALTQAKEAALTPFVIEWAGKAIKDINRSFNLAVKNAGLDRKVTPHVLRHTAASWMAADRVPFEEIAQFLGHTNPALTFRIYCKYHPDYLQLAAKALG
jgi:integrase